jgi:hypothetical protein
MVETRLGEENEIVFGLIDFNIISDIIITSRVSDDDDPSLSLINIVRAYEQIMKIEGIINDTQYFKLLLFLHKKYPNKGWHEKLDYLKKNYFASNSYSNSDLVKIYSLIEMINDVPSHTQDVFQLIQDNERRKTSLLSTLKEKKIAFLTNAIQFERMSKLSKYFDHWKYLRYLNVLLLFYKMSRNRLVTGNYFNRMKSNLYSSKRTENEILADMYVIKSYWRFWRDFCSKIIEIKGLELFASISNSKGNSILRNHFLVLLFLIKEMEEYIQISKRLCISIRISKLFGIQISNPQMV